MKTTSKIKSEKANLGTLKIYKTANILEYFIKYIFFKNSDLSFICFSCALFQST